MTDIGTEAMVRQLGSRLHDMGSLPTIPITRAIDWTTYGAGRDPMDPDWGRPRLKDFYRMQDEGHYLLPPHIFKLWYRQMVAQFNITVAFLGNRYFQIIPLHESEFPTLRHDFHWMIEPGVLVKELAFEGNSMIISGPKGSGKSAHAIWCAEAVFGLKEDELQNGKRSLLNRIMGSRAGLGEKRGAERKRLGLYHSDGVEFIANFSVYDRTENDGSVLPSPIKKAWHRVERATHYLEETANLIEKAKHTIFEFDEAGAGYNKKRSVSRRSMAIDGMSRNSRKVGQGWILVTQNAAVDLSDDVLEAATSKISLFRPADGGKPTAGLFTVPGTRLKESRLVGISEPLSHHETEEFPAFVVDLDFNAVAEYIAVKQGDAERAGVDWGRKERAEAMREAAWKFADSEADMARGASKAQISEAKLMLLTKNPTTGKSWSTEDIAMMTEADPVIIDSLRKDLEKRKREREIQSQPPRIPAVS